MNYTIRPFDKARDYDFVWELHLKENMSYIERHMGASVETVKGWFDGNIDDKKGFIVMHNDQRIGCYFVLENAKYTKLSRFFLIDNAQGFGIGRSLLTDILKDHYKPETDFVITVWEDNPVQEFWHKMGFQYVSTDKDKLMTMKYCPPSL